MVRWLRLHTSTAGGTGSIPGRATKIPHAVGSWPKKKERKEKKNRIQSCMMLADKKHLWMGFPGGAVVENLPANAGNTGSSPGLGRSHMPRSN